MSIRWDNENCRGCATLSREPMGSTKRRAPRLVVAGKLPFATRVADHFERHGWQVHKATASEDLLRTVRVQKANAVVLDTSMGQESGFLVCAKLLRAQPQLPVMLVASNRQPGDAKFAEFVGAAGYLCADDTPHQILGTINGVLRVSV